MYSWYRTTERIMYNFKDKRKQYDTLQQEYYDMERNGDVHGQSYKEVSGSGSDISDRVFDYVHKRECLERRLKRLYVEVEAVLRVYKRLMQDVSLKGERLCYVLEQIYFKHEYVSCDYMSAKHVNECKYMLVRMVSRQMYRLRRSTERAKVKQ